MERSSYLEQLSRGASGTVYFVLAVDGSSSMRGLVAAGKSRADAVLEGYQVVIDQLSALRREQPLLQIKVRVLRFATRCDWLSDWQDVGPECGLTELSPSGVTQFADAVQVTADELSRLVGTDPRMLGAALLFITDGEATDERGNLCQRWPQAIHYLDASAAGAVALRAAINVCGSGSNQVLEAFTRDPEMVLSANTAGEITRRLSRLAVHMTRQASRGVTPGDVAALQRASAASALVSISQGGWGQLQSSGGRSVQQSASMPARSQQSAGGVASRGLQSLAPRQGTKQAPAAPPAPAAPAAPAALAAPAASRGLRSLAPGGQTNWIDLATSKKK